MRVDVFLAACDQYGDDIAGGVGGQACCIGTTALASFDQPLVFEERKSGTDCLAADLILPSDGSFGGQRGDPLLQIPGNQFGKLFRKRFVLVHNKKISFLFMVY